MIDADKRTVRHFCATNEDDNGFGGVSDGREALEAVKQSSILEMQKTAAAAVAAATKEPSSSSSSPFAKDGKGGGDQPSALEKQESSKSSPVKGFGMAGNNSVGVALDVKRRWCQFDGASSTYERLRVSVVYFNDPIQNIRVG